MNRMILTVAGVLSASTLLLVDSAVKGTVLLALAAVVALILRRDSAATRHLVWLLAIVAMLVVPVLSAMLPQWRVLPAWMSSPRPDVVAVSPPSIARSPGGVIESPVRAEPSEVERPIATVDQRVSALPDSQPALVTPTAVPAPAVWSWNWINALPLVWVVGFAILMLRLSAARWMLWNSERLATVIGRRVAPQLAFESQSDSATPQDPIVMAMEAICSQLGIGRHVTLLIHPNKTIPVVWGILRCRLMLPAAARQWSDEQLQSVLLHELAHIKRRDTIVQLLAQIACALHWFNPLVWFAAWRLDVERERSCDDLVLASGIRPSAYAGHLLDVVTGLSPARWTQACGLAMARKSSLEGRLMAVLGKDLNRRGVSVALAGLALAIAAGVAVPIAMLRAGDEKWNPPQAAHISANDSSAYCVHDGKDTSYVIVYHGEVGSATESVSDPKTRTWTDAGTLTAKKPGIALTFHRTHSAPEKLSITTAPAESRDLSKPATPPRKFGQKEYDLAKGRVFVLSDSGDVRQLDIAVPVVTDEAPAKQFSKLIAAVLMQNSNTTMKLQPETVAKLKWSDPVNGLRMALAWPPSLNDALLGDAPYFQLVVQNVSDKVVHFSASNEAPNPRELNFRADNRTVLVLADKDAATAEWHLQPGHCGVLRMFTKEERDADGKTASAGIEGDLSKIDRNHAFAEMEVAKAPEGAWTGKLITGRTRGSADVAAAPAPMHKDARAYYENWLRYARANGDIPGALVGELAAAVKTFIRYNPTWETVPKLNEILPRLDATHDWKPADAIALLDEVAAVKDSPLTPAPWKVTRDTIRKGDALPKKFAAAPWGEAQPNGLRAAWVLEPGATEHRIGAALKARLLVWNSGTGAVVLQVPTFYQGGVQATDAKGREVEASGLEWTTLAQLFPCRLETGEFIEINTPGVGLGPRAGMGPWAGPRVGSNVLANPGDELTLTYSLVPLDGSEVGVSEDDPHVSGPGWWLAHIQARLNRELPLPADAAERTRMLDRAVRELFATAPSAEETARFIADKTPDALDALAKRLAARVDVVSFSGKLPTAPAKFRVLAAEANADKQPRVVLGPGEYPLPSVTAKRGDATLKIVGRPVGDRRTNDARLLFEATEFTGARPPDPHKLEVPDGWGTWAIVCRPDSDFFYLLSKGTVRKIDYSQPREVTDTPANDLPAEFRDEVKRILDIHEISAAQQAEIFEKPAAPAATPDSKTGANAPAKPTATDAPKLPKLPDEAYTKTGIHCQNFREEDAKRPGGELMGDVAWNGERPLEIGLRVAKDAKWNIGGQARVDLVIRNLGGSDLKFTQTPRADNGLSVVAIDKNGKEYGVEIAAFDGLLAFNHLLLPRFHAVTVKSLTLRVDRERGSVSEPEVAAFHLPPGDYVLRCKWSDAHPNVAHEGEWTGELTTADYKFTLAGAEISPAQSTTPPSYELPQATELGKPIDGKSAPKMSWGEPKEGLCGALRIIGELRTGVEAKAELWVRNSSAETVKFSWTHHADVGLAILTSDGSKPARETHMTRGKTEFRLHFLALPPGKAVKLKEFTLRLGSPPTSGPIGIVSLAPTPGDWTVQGKWTDTLHLEGAMEWRGELRTAEMKLRVTPEGATFSAEGTAGGNDEPPNYAKPPSVAPDAQKATEQEPVTAWGKEVGGLQAGLGFLPGQKRAYSHGETVGLVVRVRNVGKEEVKFQYLRQFFVENPPTVTDGKDKPVSLGRVDAFGEHIPVEVKLALGKEIELHELKLELGSGNEAGVGIPKYSAICGTGTFQVQYAKVLGNSSSGVIKLDPALSQLATGKLELEIKPGAPVQQEVPKPGAMLKSATEKKLKWGDPVNGLRMALAWPPTLGEPGMGGAPEFYLVLQNVSEGTVRLTANDAAPNPRRLTLQDATVVSRTVDDTPIPGDWLLQPGEAAFFRLFHSQEKTKDGRSWSAVKEQIVRVQKQYSYTAEMTIEKAPAGAWTGKLTTGATRGSVDVIPPKHKDAQALYNSWETAARADGNIPGALIGRLGESVKTFIKTNPTWETTPQLQKMLPRFDASRDWNGQDAVGLLDELGALQSTPISMALDDENQSIIRTGTPLPEELANAPWGEAVSFDPPAYPHPNGLRVAWLLEPRAAEHRLGTPLKARVLVHNSGKIPVVFRTRTWHQLGHKATDAQGAEIKTESTQGTARGLLLWYRLAPGEFIEVQGPGIGVGPVGNHEDWQQTRVGTWIEAKSGDEVTVTTAPLPLMDWNDEKQLQLHGEVPFWRDQIVARLSRHLPFPADADARLRLLHRVSIELFGASVSKEITDSFIADMKPTALASLAERLHNRPGLHAWLGSLTSAPTKFRVLPADPDAAKKPRTANNPGRYTLGGYTTLVVTRRPIGECIVNEAHLAHNPPEDTIPAPHHEITLPDGHDTWAAAWIRDTTVLWVTQEGLLRKIDFTNFAKIKETRYDGDTSIDAPIPADVREALRAALAGSDAAKPKVESPKPASPPPAAEAPSA